MKINVLGITNPMFETEEREAKNLIASKFKLGFNEEQEKLNDNDLKNIEKFQNHIKQICGTISGECYSADGMFALTKQPIEKSFARANNCATSGHLSVFGHFMATLELVDIPKALIMLLNNNHINNTSERSMRFTKIEEACGEKDTALYNKWRAIFVDKFTQTYGQKYPEIFTKSVIAKKANESARYIVSSYYKSSMVYTNSIREFTYMSRCLDDILKQGDNMHPFYKGMKKELEEFNTLLKQTGLVFSEFNDQGKKDFSLLSKNNKIVTPYYGDCIVDTYKMSLSCTAHLHRHRFVNMSIAFDEKPTFFVPHILEDDKNLVEDWLKDCESQIDVMPQALLVNINEIVPTQLITKKYAERLCYHAQLEICDVCLKQVQRILKNLDPNVVGVREQLEKITASRCTWLEGFKCSSPCGFAEGVKCTRKI